jgi:cytochrome c biogenesis protein CcmG, thiol:disulfide interchange protein DsbE
MALRFSWKLVFQAVAVAVLAALIGLLAHRVVTTEAQAGLVAAVERGETPPAPPLSLPSLDGGKEIQLADYRGKGVILNFWASWCEPCKEEAPMLQRAWEEGRDDGLVVLGVNAQDFERDARRFVARYGLTYPILHDGPGSSLGRYGLQGFPETWWIDRNGRLVAYAQGQFTEAELRANIRRALRSR